MLVGFYMVSLSLFHMIDGAITHGVHRYRDVYVVDLRALGDYELDQVNGTTTDIPKALRNLDGKRVMLTGQMWAPQRAAGKLDDFDLVYSISNCCFMGPPKVQHFVHAKAAQQPLDYAGGYVTVTGMLHVGVERSAGVIQSVYRLDAQSVQPQSN
jgi:hypothetical protein